MCQSKSKIVLVLVYGYVGLRWARVAPVIVRSASLFLLLTAY